jgi:hypothetical protein
MKDLWPKRDLNEAEVRLRTLDCVLCVLLVDAGDKRGELVAKRRLANLLKGRR